MTMDIQTSPGIVFIGVCETSRLTLQSNLLIPEFTFIGLKQSVISFIYPLPIQHLNFIFAIRNPLEAKTIRIDVRNPDGSEFLWFSVNLELRSLADISKPVEDNSEEKGDDGSSINSAESMAAIPSGYEGYSLFSFKPVDQGVSPVALKPGNYKVVVDYSGDPKTIGSLNFLLATPPDLSPASIAAIKSRPHAAKSLLFKFTCKECSERLMTYTALERNPKIESDGWEWYKELPDTFTCTCGSINEMDLTMIRSNLHGLLGHSLATGPQISLSHLYDKESLESTFQQFQHILEEYKDDENAVQEFIESNPILLNPFSPDRIFFKKPILTRYQTDLAVMNPKKELLLIELEKPSARLLNRDGGVAAPTTHAFGQVRDWLQFADEHRAAVLEGFDLKQDDVSKVIGAVITSRDSPYSDEHLRKVKSTDFGRVSLFTYDDLLLSLGILIREMIFLGNATPGIVQRRG